MGDEISLKELEQKAYLSYHEDGLIDLFIGGYLIFLGANAFMKMRSLSYIVPAAGFWVWSYVKRKVTFPRIGYVRFTDKTRRRIFTDLLIVDIIAAFVTLTGLFYLQGRPELTPWWVTLLNRNSQLFIGCVLATMLTLQGRIMTVSRLYMYSAATFIVFTLSHFLLHIPGYGIIENFGVACILIGIMITSCGSFHFHGFLVRYSKGSMTY